MKIRQARAFIQEDAPEDILVTYIQSGCLNKKGENKWYKIIEDLVEVTVKSVTPKEHKELQRELHKFLNGHNRGKGALLD